MTKKIRVFEMFAGYGGASFALKKAGVDFECVGYSEVDKYAIQCFEQNHKGKNYGDCSKIDPNDLPDFDLLTGGFPCQDVSIAGSRDLSKGRTMLVNDIFRIIAVKKPKYVVLENVKGLLSMPKLFDNIRYTLNRLGYGMPLYKVLNTKDYGVPQNRERVFIICKLGGFEFMEFQFPKKQKSQLFLKDILEPEVDKKYYLKQEQVGKLMKGFDRFGSVPEEDKAIMIGNLSRYKMESPRNPNFREKGISWCVDTSNNNGVLQLKDDISGFTKRRFQDKDVCDTLCARDYKDPKVISVLTPDRLVKRQNGRRFKTDGEPMFTLNTQDKHGILQISSMQKHNTIRNDGINNCLPSAMGLGGGHTPMILDLYNHKIKDDGVCITLSEPHHNNLRIHDTISIRKLTPKECFRLMGFLDDEINVDGLSDTQKYKLAGNGWDVNLVSKIFKRLLQ